MRKKILCALLASVLVLSTTACSSGSSTTAKSSESAKWLGDDAAFGKFTKTVNVHIGQSVDPTDKTLPSGDSVSNNQYTRYLKKNYNINIIVDWTAATGNDFNQKVSLSIASGKLPDGMVVTDRTYMTKAASAGLLYNITDLFKEYSSSQVQKIMESTDGRAMDFASYNDQMVSLPNVSVDADGVHVMWIRQDWLDKLKLSVPKTISDIEKTAKAFVDNKMAGSSTIGIAGPSKNTFMYCTFLTSSNNIGGFDPIFQANDAYPGYWVDNSGTVSYGSISDNTKKTLQALASWYKEGIIDPEMGTRDNVSDPINANQCGIFFGPWWAGGYGNGDSFKNDKNADWQAYPVYTDDGKWNVHMKAVGTTFTLISKNASEDAAKAIIIMNNALVRDESTFDVSVGIGWYPLRNVMSSADECEYEYKELHKVLNGTTKPADYNIKGNVYKLIYSDASKVKNVVTGDYDDLHVKDFNMKNFGDFQRMYSLLVGDRPFASTKIDKKVFSVTYSQTATMETKWSNLKKMEDETFLKIVVGQSPITAFDQFVTDWKSQGGDEITKEVQALEK